MKPSWKTYDTEAWNNGVAGCTPRPSPLPKDRFLWNSLGICTNPHVFGVAAKGWRIGIYTAQNKRGRWVAGADVSFHTTGGYCYGVRNVDADSFPDEWGAQARELRSAALWVEKSASITYASCPIPPGQAHEALCLISEALEIVEPKKVPVYTQLSLF